MFAIDFTDYYYGLSATFVSPRKPLQMSKGWAIAMVADCWGFVSSRGWAQVGSDRI